MSKISRLLLLISMIAPAKSLFSQMDTEGLISTSGTSLIGVNTIIDYSLGNWTSLNMGNSNGQITNGIQQSNYFVITSVSEVNPEVNIKVYPNPTIEQIYIDLDDSQEHEMIVVLRSAEGKIVLNQTNKKTVSLDLKDLPSEVYYLSVFIPEINSRQQFKIVKIN